MEEYCMECLQVNNAITRLVDKFWKKYYDWDFKMSRVERQDEELHYNFEINQDYWNIDEVYTALWFDIPEDILHEWKEYSLDYYIREVKKKNPDPFINLKNFYLMKKDNGERLKNIGK